MYACTYKGVVVVEKEISNFVKGKLSSINTIIESMHEKYLLVNKDFDKYL